MTKQARGHRQWPTILLVAGSAAISVGMCSFVAPFPLFASTANFLFAGRYAGSGYLTNIQDESVDYDLVQVRVRADGKITGKAFRQEVLQNQLVSNLITLRGALTRTPARLPRTEKAIARIKFQDGTSGRCKAEASADDAILFCSLRNADFRGTIVLRRSPKKR